jgi:hypothetical protein
VNNMMATSSISESELCWPRKEIQDEIYSRVIRQATVFYVSPAWMRTDERSEGDNTNVLPGDTVTAPRNFLEVKDHAARRVSGLCPDWSRPVRMARGYCNGVAKVIVFKQDNDIDEL